MVEEIRFIEELLSVNLGKERFQAELSELREAEKKAVGLAECPHSEENCSLFAPFAKNAGEPGSFKLIGKTGNTTLWLAHCLRLSGLYETFEVSRITKDNVYSGEDILIRFVIDEARGKAVPVYYKNKDMQYDVDIFEPDYSECKRSVLLLADNALHSFLVTLNEPGVSITHLPSISPQFMSHLLGTSLSMPCLSGAGLTEEDMAFLEHNGIEDYYCYLDDCGHAINAIPLSLLEEAKKSGDPGRYVTPFPLDYVREKGFTRYGEYLACDGEFDSELGLLIPEKYSRWRY